jgi:hypothetical protein
MQLHRILPILKEELKTANMYITNRPPLSPRSARIIPTARFMKQFGMEKDIIPLENFDKELATTALRNNLVKIRV